MKPGRRHPICKTSAREAFEDITLRGYDLLRYSDHHAELLTPDGHADAYLTRASVIKLDRLLKEER